ncbi:hypothetical protein BDY19DRAFT_897951, partial [Irpex rosettiformis]
MLKVLHPSQRRVVVPIGPRIPIADNPSENPRYCRLMLMLFKPWRSVCDLKDNCTSWQVAFASFIETAPDVVKALINNMQILHECRTASYD